MMPKVTIEVPEGFEESVKALEETLQRPEGHGGGDQRRLGRVRRRVAGGECGVEETERQMKRRLLRGLDVDAARALIQGQLHARVGRSPRRRTKRERGPSK